jgi:hypothetical protein
VRSDLPGFYGRRRRRLTSVASEPSACVPGSGQSSLLEALEPHVLWDAELGGDGRLLPLATRLASLSQRGQWGCWDSLPQTEVLILCTQLPVCLLSSR